MCGRFGFVKYDDEFYPRFSISNRLSDFSPQYNIAPGQYAPVIVEKDNKRIIEYMKWGLIPFWAKDPKIGNKLINAKVETVTEKPSFKYSVKTKRCLVPATNFYEWKREGDHKTPHYIGLKDRKYFAIAGLYSIWKDVEGKEFKTFTILTKDAERGVEKLHNRMPVILDDEEEYLWLQQDADISDILNQAKEGPKDDLDIFPVSKDLKPLK